MVKNDVYIIDFIYTLKIEAKKRMNLLISLE